MPVNSQRIGRFVTSACVLPRSVQKKLMITVVTTNSTATVAITAPYCRNMGIGV
jgi:hypothetical protein